MYSSTRSFVNRVRDYELSRVKADQVLPHKMKLMCNNLL